MLIFMNLFWGRKKQPEVCRTNSTPPVNNTWLYEHK